MTAIQGQSRADSRSLAKSQSRSSSATDWSLTGWRSRPALQMPVYPDAAALAGAEARLRRAAAIDAGLDIGGDGAGLAGQFADGEADLAGRRAGVVRKLFHFGRDDGKIKWVTPLTQYKDEKRRSPVLWGGPVLAGDRLLVVGTLGEMLAVSPYTGEILGKLDVRDPVRLAPIIANRTIYVLTDSGRLIALR